MGALFVAAQTAAGRVTGSWTEALGGAEDRFSINAIKVLLVLAGALAVFAAVRAIHVTVPLLPLSRAQRDRLARFGPFAELVAWALFALGALAWLLEGEPTATLVVLTIGAVTVITAAWSAIRDYLTGVVLRVERLTRVGDRIRVDGIQGRVTALSTRVVQLLTPDGDTVVLPYSRVSRAALVRSPRGTGAALHTFVVSGAPDRAAGALRAAIHEAVLLCHWAAPGHAPTMRYLGDHAFEVTVQPLSDARAIDLEEAVRAFCDAVDPAAS